LTHATIATADRTEKLATDPLEILHHIIRHYRLPAANYPPPVCSGLLGYLSYDLKDCIEDLPRTSIDDLHLPHLYMVAPSIIVVEDRHKKTKTIHVSSLAGDAAERKASFEQSLAAPAANGTSTSAAHCGATASCFTRNEYMHAVDAIRDYIVRGHVYQVNMSQRFEASFTGNAFALFTALFARNPAPFFAYINAGDHHIVSTSPERFIEVRGKCVETRPIKGTRPRGATPGEDLERRDHLLSSRKDDAELSMIVDLLRNDIGKVCRAGSVKVREHKRIEAYENVYHLVSVIDGVLDDDKDAVDLIRATFPGGSITGCPKIRSMEIIDELEPVRRHIYTGSIGYIGFHDAMDLSIAIRTAIIKDDRLVFSVGGGVVYDSDPADEYEETLHKGKTLMNAFNDAYAKNAPHSPIAWCNGKFMPLEEITVSVNSEGFLYGYGIFETIRVQNGTPCRLPEHCDRFNRSWRTCFGTEPPDITWNAVIAQVIDRCGFSNDIAAVKLLAAAGTPGKPETMTMLVTARRYVHRLKTLGRDGVHCAVYPHRRHSHLSSHKTMNYMFCKMANDWARQRGADEAIIVNIDGSVCETATANILCIIDGKWFWPASEHVLPGIMEKAVGDLLMHRGTPVETRAISVDELKKADRVFMTNALMGIVPVLRIDETPLCGDATGLCADINATLFG
jgi:para-aminobenzoate synthetase component I